MMRRGWIYGIASLCALACGGQTESDTSAEATTVGEAASSEEGADDAAATSPESGTSSGAVADEAGTSSGSAAGDTEDATTSDGATGESTGGPVLRCDEPEITSTCANPNSIVRGFAVLAAEGAPTTGTLRIQLNHEYLGGGATGGIPHSGAYVSEVDLSGGPVPFAVDMCVAGEMWSEENCGFMLHVILDANADGVLDPGEPVGSVPLFLSCTGDPVCMEVALDCTDGSSCLAFADPPYCGCAPSEQSCASPIVAC